MAKAGKNTHLEHLEDEIINNGVQGAKNAISILERMGEFLSGTTGQSIKVTTKFDGAPAIICGTDPADGEFFVGTKAVFSNDPKLCKTPQNIAEWYSGELADKLRAALQYLPTCNIKGVLQGDLMFTNDKVTKRVDGRPFITFKPNTITYAVDPNTPMGKQVNRAQLGIVFHTKYTGPSIAEMKASFVVPDGDFKSSQSVWAQKSTFQNIGGAASFSVPEKRKYDAAVRKAGGSLAQAGSILNQIQTGKKSLGIDTEMKKFFNNYVKLGQNIPSVERAYADFMYHLGGEYDKVISKYKTVGSQANKSFDFVDAVFFIEDNKRQFKMLIASYMNITAAKMMLVNKMNQVASMRTFIERNGDLEATAPEGFVAISGKGATKLVDRLEFSKLNFTLPKAFGR